MSLPKNCCKAVLFGSFLWKGKKALFLPENSIHAILETDGVLNEVERMPLIRGSKREINKIQIISDIREINAFRLAKYRFFSYLCIQKYY